MAVRRSTRRWPLVSPPMRSRSNSSPRCRMKSASPTCCSPRCAMCAARRATGRTFRSLLREHASAVRATMLTRRTQTNEAGRCATLLPVLARLPQPLALLEVGASAGLCLLPDRYGYDYGHRQLAPASPDAPVFPCRANPATPLPAGAPACCVAAGPGSPSGGCRRCGALRLAGDAGVARAIRPAASPARGARGGKARSAARRSGRSADGPCGLRATGARGMRRWSYSTRRCSHT